MESGIAAVEVARRPRPPERLFMKRYTQIVKVRSYELDAQGHVNYAVYLNYLEYARVTIMERLGLPFDEFIRRGTYVVIAEAHLKYLRPARLGDNLSVTLEGLKAGRTGMSFRQDIFIEGTGHRVLEAELRAVFIDGKGRPIPIPDDFREAFFAPDATAA